MALTILSLAAAVFWTMRSLRRHIHRRIDTEQALREEHAFRKAMEDSLETGMRAVDLEGRIIYVNPAFCRMVGYDEKDLIGHAAPQPYLPPEDRERIEAAMQAAWMASVLDITERKRTRERIRQEQEKLAATARLVTMGEMASTIAHELNQPLSAIASYSTGCLNLLAGGGRSLDEIKNALQKTARQAERAGHIIRRVHELVRKSEPARSRVRLNSVVEEAVGFAAAEAHKRRVTIISQLLKEDAELDADPLLLQQVLLNLVRNGMDAMDATPPENRMVLVAAERAENSVTVRVADRGCGISPEVRAQLFEPFFTTKAEGMGMGLNICRSIVEWHRGRVWADPNPGGGAVFSFSLPLEPP